MPAAPEALRTKMKKYASFSHHRRCRTSGFPCTNGLTAYAVFSPVTRCATVIDANALRLVIRIWMTSTSPNLTPAGGCQDLPVLPHALSIVRGGPLDHAAHEVLTSALEVASPCGIPLRTRYLGIHRVPDRACHAAGFPGRNVICVLR